MCKCEINVLKKWYIGYCKVGWNKSFSLRLRKAQSGSGLLGTIHTLPFLFSGMLFPLFSFHTYLVNIIGQLSQLLGLLPLVIKPLLELCLQASAVCCPGALGTGVGFLICGNGMEHLPSLPRNLLDFSEWWAQGVSEGSDKRSWRSKEGHSH